MKKLLILSIAIFLIFVPMSGSAYGLDIDAKALTDHECNVTEWHFVINQIDVEANAPASIHVTWADGSADIALDTFTGGVAHYRSTAHLDSTVLSATASIYAQWSGQFNLSHGPCNQTTTTTSTSTTSTTLGTTTTTIGTTTSTAPKTTATSIATTPTTVGNQVLGASIARDELPRSGLSWNLVALGLIGFTLLGIGWRLSKL